MVGSSGLSCEYRKLDPTARHRGRPQYPIDGDGFVNMIRQKEPYRRSITQRVHGSQRPTVQPFNVREIEEE